MARIPRSAVGDISYHVISRANSRQQIFQKEKDHEVFERILFDQEKKVRPN